MVKDRKYILNFLFWSHLYSVQIVDVSSVCKQLFLGFPLGYEGMDGERIKLVKPV